MQTDSSDGKKVNIYFISLGCDKNRVDTEEILGMFRQQGWFISSDPSEAEVILVNTCSFIQDAREEAVDTVLRMAFYKHAGSCKVLLVTGCMAQMYREEILGEMPEVDLVVGLNSYHRLPRLIRSCLHHQSRMAVYSPRHEGPFWYGKRHLTTPSYSVYLKIAEGCNNRCHYCIIPSLRGPYREKSPETIIREAAYLVRKGAREVNLVAQDTTYYGVKKYGSTSLPELLHMLSGIKNLKWIRVLYTHPAHISDQLITTISQNDKVCPYIDVPLQHVSTPVLRKMGRPYRRADIENLVKKLKSNGLTIRTTFMLGFPGEREKHFLELLNFIKRHPLDRVGAFTYSPEEGTPACSYPQKIPSQLQLKRYHRLMKLQRRISYLLNLQEVGKIHPVLVEKREKNTAGYRYRGRTPRQAPEVDGYTNFSAYRRYEEGEIVNIMVTNTSPYDLYGNPL